VCQPQMSLVLHDALTLGLASPLFDAQHCSIFLLQILSMSWACVEPSANAESAPQIGR
jgi:hypothetical protein